MPSKNTWVDYGNLGANLLQTAQLSGVRRSLDHQTQMAATELAIEQNQDRLRESIFQVDTLLRKLQGARARNQNTIGVYALARESLLNIKRNPISEHLRSFEDKTRLRDVEEGFETLLDDCASLSADDQEQAELCAKYRSEESDLDLAISVKQTRQQLDEARAKLSEVESSIAPSNWAKNIAILGFYTLIAGLALITFVISDDVRHPFLKVASCWVTGIGAFAALAGLCFAAIFQLDQANGSESDKEVWSRKVMIFETALTAKVRGDLSQWESKSLAELQQERQERTALIYKILTTKRLQNVTQ